VPNAARDNLDSEVVEVVPIPTADPLNATRAFAYAV
jgi:hypothetical protein